MRKLYCTLILSLLTIFSTTASSTYRFQHLSTIDGLSQSEVYAFCKSRSGHMWIGTGDGLNRYDGHEIITFNTDIEDDYSLVGNIINALCEDDLQRLWVGTSSGLSLYNIEDGRFYTISLSKGDEHDEIKRLKYHNGVVYVGTTKHLYMVDASSSDIEVVVSSAQKLPFGELNITNSVVGIDVDSRGDVWCFTNWQLYRVKGEKLLFVCDLPLDGWIVNVSIDSKDRAWIASLGANGGLMRYDLRSGKSTMFRNDKMDETSISSNNVSGVVIDSEGNLWASTRDSGINLASANSLDRDSISFSRITNIPLYPYGLSTNLAYSIYFCDNILWVGTTGGGVNYYDFNSKKINCYTTEKNGALVRSIYTTESTLFLGIQRGGLHTIDVQRRELRKIDNSSRTVFHIEHIDGDRYWVCSEIGLTIEEISSRGVKRLQTLIEGSTFHIVQSSESVYWVSAFLGLFRVEMSGNTVRSIMQYTTNTTPSISQNNCRVARYDALSNKLWVGTEGGGLNCVVLNKAHKPLYISKYVKDDSSTTNSISNNFVRDIYIEEKGRVWAGTYEGLNLFNIDNSGDCMINVFTKRDGLLNNTIESVRGDMDGNIWVSTHKGISKISNGDYKITNFTQSDGLHGLEFAEHCSHISPDGNLFFGGVGGLTYFNPRDIVSLPQSYNPLIVEFSLHGNIVKPNDIIDGEVILSKPIYLTDEIKLHHKDNNFEFKFSAMSFLSADKIIYSYRLLGYDDNWRTTTSNQRTATYTNIGHGRYEFEVKAMDDTGNWSETERIFIEIETPLYKEWYMIALFALIVMAILIGIMIMIIRRRRDALEIAHREELYEMEFSRMQFYINMSHDLQTPLTLILGPLSQLISNYDFDKEVVGKLALMDRNAKKLLKMVNQILEIRKAEVGALQIRNLSIEVCAFVRERMTNFQYAFKQKNLSFDLQCGDEKIWTLVDSDILDKILYNIISNSLKYTDRGGVLITVTTQEGMISIAVKDSGRGIASDQHEAIFVQFNNNESRTSGYGIGLSHCREMIKLLSGTITVDSEFGKGATFTITIPIIEVESEELPAIESNQEVDNSEVDNTSTSVCTRPTLLIVEDEADMREYILSIFQQEYNVLQAVNGEDGLATINREHIDIVVSDVVMPKMNGVDMCRSIKGSPQTSHIPVILLTALKGEHARYQGLETGADDYVNKPFDEKELLLKVRNILKTKQNLTNVFNSQFMLKISAPDIKSYDTEFLSKVVEYMEEHYVNPNFSIEELESTMSMSHASFYRRITAITGSSMKDLLVNYRLERARLLVVDTTMRITEIAEAVGFNSSSYFSSCFKKKYGVIALDYRKKALTMGKSDHLEQKL